MRISHRTVNPMPNPPIAFQVPRSSMAVPYTTSTKKKVNTSSTRMQVPTVTPAPNPCVPRWTGFHTDSVNTSRSSAPAATPPSSCDTTYQPAFSLEILPPTKAPTVTAGLKWPPEIWPMAEIMTASTQPCASAIPTRPAFVTLPSMSCATQMDPAPMKHKAKVPMASATYGFNALSISHLRYEGSLRVPLFSPLSLAGSSSAQDLMAVSVDSCSSIHR